MAAPQAFAELTDAIAALAGVTPPTPFASPDHARPDHAVPVNPDRYRGTYEREGLREEVVDIADGLVVRTTLTGLPAKYQPTPEMRLVPVAEDRFLADIGSADGCR
ncbi:hypothetical protein [Nocardia terpenica]|uniref:Uncharacterized protein n=1 Tax=Nocardia terpenica TaxID=455432 RepID=A0A6G9Z1J1_9NOCA|nr:hypothetical protein [Nocardia terpenica]QIS19455.1 hypothetical protein F6W96_15355 [Nocardia terpenica]